MPAPRKDAALLGAVELARTGAESIADAGCVGEHLGAEMTDERLATHYFACTSRGYGGWRWAVSLARVPRGRAATICETNLVPGDDAILAPEWLPWAERLQPGDIGPGDVSPRIDDDPYLVQGFEATGDEEVDAVALDELGLGRPRVLSAEGRDAAAQRWHDGEGGPLAEVARRAPAPCSSCGFFLPMAGALRSVFGVCANAWSPSDGRVVTLDHGCGAHSEVDIDSPAPEKVEPARLDDLAVELV